ncbi:ATP-binding protein [Acinetobacter sp. ANC 4945]|uniref:DNA mismatch repair protein n=1 Tax=Acinetobacter amyesii TaxID=2942470 RepID=A0A1T1GSB5_9GAMM|nr:ATP-binding protein [Acinetobacter amyesii]MCL6246397.1 ATP-binding protein [Acinetobacter amyesii]OOV80483.1 DNA mismatch repair protein [Acinetobacter amyesii]
MSKFQGKAQITDEGIKKHFKSTEPYKAIFEYVWNGFDAKASNVHINIIRNDFGGLATISIIDDGDGIDLENRCNSFEKFNESHKKHDDDLHGSHGRGRLAFHRLAKDAIWFTKWNNQNAKICISDDAISHYVGDFIDESSQCENLKRLKSGTCVILNSIYPKIAFPSDQVFIENLQKEFSWFLIINPQKKLFLEDKEIPILDHETVGREVEIDDIEFKITAIRWHDKLSHEKSCNYLLDVNNKIIFKELSKANNKIDFHTSCYAQSEWNDTYNKDELEIDPQAESQQKILKKVTSEMSLLLKEIYEEYLREYVDAKIEDYDKQGYFPSYDGYDHSYALWRKENTKEAFKSIYLADPKVFSKLALKPLKIIIRMLDKLLVSKENDAIFDVLNDVLDLNDLQVDLLAKQLKSTTLESIISTIETLQKRELAISKLKELMDNHYKIVLETPDLQKIIEANTWLFGPQYEILGAEEDSFSKIARNLRTEIPGIDNVGIDDLESDDQTEIDIEGLNRQVDLFLARKKYTFDASGKPIYKCIIVEIKKPSLALNKKHLTQLNDYAEIISKHPSFNSGKLIFELILIGRKISKDDFYIKSQLENNKSKGELGLVLHTEKIKCYVKDWYTIFDEFDLSNKFLLDNLKSQYEDLSEESKVSLVGDLQGQKAS